MLKHTDLKLNQNQYVLTVVAIDENADERCKDQARNRLE